MLQAGPSPIKSPPRKKTKSRGNLGNRAGLDPDWLNEGSLDGLRVVGIDPGLRDFVTGAVRGDCASAKNTFRLFLATMRCMGSKGSFLSHSLPEHDAAI